jgi:hypothetical protein
MFVESIDIDAIQETIRPYISLPHHFHSFYWREPTWYKAA